MKCDRSRKDDFDKVTEGLAFFMAAIIVIVAVLGSVAFLLSM
jgi:hypothetical protein